MIPWRDIFSKLQIGLFFFNNKIMGNGGAYKGCNNPMKDATDINLKTSSDWINDKGFRNEELWEI